MITQEQLVDLANHWEPEASQSPPGFRKATCVVCAAPMVEMWHLWLGDGGFKKEIHMCARCGMDYGLMVDETLIVVAAVDDRFTDNLQTLNGGPVLRMDTSAGGHPSAAFIRAYRENPQYHSYLFLQDSMMAHVGDCVAPFKKEGHDVVAWGLFGMFFDNEMQREWVESQFSESMREPAGKPSNGIFGPTFYATRDAMRKAEPFFLKTPEDRNQAQGTERGWAYTFKAAGVEVGTLGQWDNGRMQKGDYPVFTKTFAARP